MKLWDSSGIPALSLPHGINLTRGGVKRWSSRFPQTRDEPFFFHADGRLAVLAQHQKRHQGDQQQPRYRDQYGQGAQRLLSDALY